MQILVSEALLKKKKFMKQIKEIVIKKSVRGNKIIISLELLFQNLI